MLTAFEITTILSKNNKNYSNSEKNKFLGVLLIVLLDDIAENLQNERMLTVAIDSVSDELRHFTRFRKLRDESTAFARLERNNSFSEAEIDYLRFTIEITREMLNTVLTLPNYDVLKKEYYKYWLKVLDCFVFTLRLNNFIKNNNHQSIKKYFNSLNFSYYANTTGHNMHVILAMIIDLMALRKINKKEIGFSIKISEEAQVMGRIGNWLSTWKRELREKDFSSGIAIYCINNGIIKINDIKSYVLNNDNLIEKRLIKQIERSGAAKYFLSKWSSCRQRIESYSQKITIFSTKKYLHGAKLFLDLHTDNINKI